MWWIRSRKYLGSRAVGAVLLCTLIFSVLYPCHEYVGYGTGSITLGYDICDDSPCLTVKAKYQGVTPVDFTPLSDTGSAVLLLFAHSIFHPPRA
jgi:hypothetical protein